MKKRCRVGFQAVLIIVVTLAFGLAGKDPARADNGNKFVPGELLIQVKAGVSKGKIDTLLKSHGAATAGEIETIRIRKIKVPVHALEKVSQALENNPNISFVENNYVGQGGFDPNDERYPSQWHLPKISAPGGWDLNTGAETVPIAIIDSGVDPAHPDLNDKLIAGYNFLENNTDTHDVLGHGTAVAGSAAAMSHNGIGVAGVSWGSPIMPLVVLNSSNSASYYDIARAINYAADKGVRIMNISIGGSSYSSTMQSAVNYAWGKGAVIFACAHNYSTDTPYYPAACANVAAVSATTSSDTRASFSNYGNWVDICAPGVSVFTTNRGGDYGYHSGTSFSSPIAAGVAALILSINPSLTNAQVVDILTQHADDLGTSGFDTYFGYGRVNVFQSLLAAMEYVPEPDTTGPAVTITSPRNGETVGNGVTVSVSATDDGGVDRVEFYIDGVLLSADTSAPYAFSWDTTVYADGGYDLSAIAYDTAGNQGRSNSITVSVSNEVFEDTVAPEVVITSPRDGAYVPGRIIIQATATDDSSVTRMELYVDGVLRVVKYKSALSWNWNVRKETNGEHAILVKAFDTSGNEGINTVTVYK